MYIISACLVGVRCRYNASITEDEKLCKLVQEGKALAICPEQLAGLTTPRLPCEIKKDETGLERVINCNGEDLTAEFQAGAWKTLQIAQIIGAQVAILKSRSPSCGKGKIYSGNFTGKLIAGDGFTTRLLQKNGIQVYTEEDF